jgi:uncharacterized protein (TIGR02145 family)
MPKFRYKITSPVADEAFIDAPDGWKDSESIFPRSDTYKGIFRKFAANDLTFKSNGAAKLREINAVNSFESEGNFIQEEEDWQTYTWFQRFKGKFDFVKYESIDGNEGKSININVIDSGFWNTIKNRENIRPQLNQLTSLDGFPISGFTNEEQWVSLPSIPEIRRSQLIQDGLIYNLSHALQLNVNYANESNTRKPTSIDIISQESSFYQVFEAVNNVDIDIDYFARVSISSHNAISELRIKHYDSFGIQISNQLLNSISGNVGEVKIFSYVGTKSFTPDMGDYIILAIESTAGIENVTAEYTVVDIASNVNELSKVQISGMKIHELLSRNLQIITGVDIPLYSEILGDTESEPRSYASVGAMSNLLVTSGERVRGFTREESPLTLGFKEIFESLYALRPICAVIEKINGIDNLRIEAIKYAFDDRIILTIDNASNIKESYLSDRIFSRILVGFEKAEYEERDGLFEYNQKSEFSTPVSVVNNDYNIVSKIGADTNSINNARAKSKAEFPTEDTRYDNNKFFITLIKNDTAVLNGNFTSWTDDNTPDNWDVFSGTVLRKFILGSDRMMFETGFFGTAARSQDIVFGIAEELNLKISYENITHTLTGNGSAGYLLKLDTGSTVYYYNGSEWIETPTAIQVWYATNIPQTPENELQSLISYSEDIAIMPDSGTITLTLFGTIGVIIDDVFSGESQYIAKTNEGYSSVQNAIFGDNSLNLDITPARNVRQHGPIIRACSENKLSQYLKFNTSEKNSTLSTQKDSESSPVVENADIQIADLAEPFFKPNQIEFNMVFDKAVIDVLNDTFAGETKPKYLGMVRFRQNTSENYKYVWLLNPNTGGESQLGKMSGIEVNTDYVTPIQEPDVINYGYLYNWYAVSDVRNISADGWNVPSQAEMTTLQTYVGGQLVAGNKLKEANFDRWIEDGSPLNHGTDDYGFTAVGGGRRFDGLFEEFKNRAYIWNTEGFNATLSKDGNMYSYSPAFDIGIDRNVNGESIRLLKDLTTLTHGQTGTYAGNDGKVYRTICIGTQEWLADNLAETKYRNSDSIPTETDDATWDGLTTGAKCAYDNDENNV